MKITLDRGEYLAVDLADADGTFVIDYGYTGDEQLTVSCDMPDSLGRNGTIYLEQYGSANNEPDNIMLDINDDIRADTLTHIDAIRNFIKEPGSNNLDYIRTKMNYMVIDLMSSLRGIEE